MRREIITGQKKRNRKRKTKRGKSREHGRRGREK